MSKKNGMDRRQFIKNMTGSAIAIIGFPTIVPATVFGKQAPSNKINVGCIGLGWMGTANLEGFLNEADARVVAVCDIDAHHLEKAKNTVNAHYGNKDCATYHYFRDLIAREDIDVVSLALPDHWHAIPAIEAARVGKDIYGEKPLSHTLKEGRAICNAIKRYNRIWQTGSWQRSRSNFRFACELVRNGRIGRVHTVEVGLPSGFSDFGGSKEITKPPKELDYDLWLGPAPYAPYAQARVHKNWRWHLDYGGGQLMDWVGHHADIAHWGLGFDDKAPVFVEGYGTYADEGLWNAATRYRITAKYANGLTMIIAGGYADICNGRGGTKWIGTDGWIWVNRGAIDANPKHLLKEKIGSREIHLYKSPGHIRNFLDCVKSRKTTLTPCETAHHSAIPGHLGQIAMILGRKILFNPDTEEIIGDAAASKMLGNSFRKPWSL